MMPTILMNGEWLNIDLVDINHEERTDYIDREKRIFSTGCAGMDK